jgi:hypothetical protein
VKNNIRKNNNQNFNNFNNYIIVAYKNQLRYGNNMDHLSDNVVDGATFDSAEHNNI